MKSAAENTTERDKMPANPANLSVQRLHSGSEDGYLWYVADSDGNRVSGGWLNESDAEYDLRQTWIPCTECKGTGQVADFSRDGEEPNTRCPWCSGCGLVALDYVLRGFGHNGDFPFSEVYEVSSDLQAVKRYAEREMATGRFANCLPDGTPTLQGFEIQGSDGTLISLENTNGTWISA